MEDICKTLTKVSADVAFLQYVTVDSALQHFSFLGLEKFSSMKTLRMCSAISNFYECFGIILNENLTHVVFFHAACWLFYRPKQAHTFSTLQKSRFWARSHMISLHARVRKPFRKKCKKTRPGAPPERLCIWYLYRSGFERIVKKLKQETTRIESGNKRGTLRGRRPRGTDGPCFVKKTSFFEKKRVFFKYDGNCTLGPNFGASLRRPNWPCPESPVVFYRTFFKKCAPTCATRFPLSDR